MILFLAFAFIWRVIDRVSDKIGQLEGICKTFKCILYFCNFPILDCGYECHIKCIENTVRICANVKRAEKPQYETNICPETNLAEQNYKCAECKSTINFRKSTYAIARPSLCQFLSCWIHFLFSHSGNEKSIIILNHRRLFLWSSTYIKIAISVSSCTKIWHMASLGSNPVVLLHLLVPTIATRKNLSPVVRWPWISQQLEQFLPLSITVIKKKSTLQWKSPLYY